MARHHFCWHFSHFFLSFSTSSQCMCTWPSSSYVENNLILHIRDSKLATPWEISKVMPMAQYFRTSSLPMYYLAWRPSSLHNLCLNVKLDHLNPNARCESTQQSSACVLLFFPQTTWLVLHPLCRVLHEKRIWPEILAQIFQHSFLATPGRS